MKSLLVVISLAALGGCAVAPPGGYYATAVPQNVDPHQWHVVQSQPVASTTVVSGDGYTSAPVYVDQSDGWTQQVYVPAPVYYQQPYYNYYPPVSIGLDFGWYGGGWGGGRGRGWGGGGRGGWGHGGHR